MKKTILSLAACCLFIPQANAQSKGNPAKPQKSTTNMNVSPSNVLLNPFETKHQTAPFSKIKLEDFKPAVEQAIAEAKAEIDAIANNKAKPTFKNTIEALEFSGQKMGRITSIFFNLNSAETNPEMQKLAQQISPLTTAFGNDVTLNTALFNRVKVLYDQRQKLGLNQEQMMVLEKRYKNFARNGALLNEAQKAKLREIDTELSKLSLKFNENVLADTQAYSLHITNPKDLSGLPDGTIEAAASTAKKRGLEGWVFTLDVPSYSPFVTYADNRELRKQMSMAYGARGFQNNANNNVENIKRITTLRHQRAQLLGYKTHANFVLEERMAKTPENVNTFLSELLDKAKPAAQKEYAQLSAFAKKRDNIQTLEKWDASYYSEKLKKELYDLDTEALKPYFEINQVLNGAFVIAERLFGITFTEVKDIDVYHPEVTTYEVKDADGKFLAVFYTDFHPRPGKRGGAWMTSFKGQYRKDGVDSRPHVANICNFTRPTDTKPSLLTFNEVTTLFHEFGHGLHGILANSTYPSVSGTAVSWDFVELPSQIMENWCYEPEALKIFAKHYQTGEVIPQQYINKIKESATFMQGLATLRQLSFGMLDMAYHAQDPTQINDVKAFENKAMSAANLYPDVAENMMSTSFSHIFAGGYSSGYYSYKWAEVLDADAFEYFQEKGIFNKEVAHKFREYILSKGGTEQPMELYKKFRGQEPKPEALLKRLGLM